MRQVNVSLPDDLRAKLDAVVAKSGNSLGEEIRQRLERTIEQDAVDPVTRELLAGIVNLAATVQADLCTAWHSHQEVHGAFAAAIAQRLAAYQPLPKSPEEIFDLLRATGLGDLAASAVRLALQSPSASGAVIERADQRTHTYEHLRRLQEARHPPPSTPPQSRPHKPRKE
jgi:hypothetical protein